MKKALELDLADLKDILEGFTLKLDKMTEAELIDLAARLKPVAKHCKTIDEYVKEAIKTKLRHKDGVRLGGLFRAVLKLVPTKRLDQAGLKENEPAIFNEYCKDATDERVTFELR
jgi:hypothetical protein